MEAANIFGSQSNTTIGLRSNVALAQKLFAEAIGAYVIIFAWCGSVEMYKLQDDESITFGSISMTWGAVVMVMVYSMAQVSGAHFNPAVTLIFTIFRRLPWKLASLYILAQLTGSILASGTLTLLLDVTSKSYFGTIPVGSNVQSLAIEIIISFLLMFVVCGVSTDDRMIEHLGGLAIGMTIILNVFVAGPISGASMNPARSIGPAIVKQVYKGLWVYIVGPLIGTVAGAFVYTLIRSTDKPLLQLVKVRLVK
ncbi:probable aquaporin NIP-type [Solanum dulcamara]|uniref:probable aquaporin NIP-type n=1 Tax=Solanum dulcamara TaxID=45834 RepID=UPI002486374F|nr:probable aquaporin NIP-type [Solanum dulcamara]